MFSKLNKTKQIDWTSLIAMTCILKVPIYETVSNFFKFGFPSYLHEKSQVDVHNTNLFLKIGVVQTTLW